VNGKSRGRNHRAEEGAELDERQPDQQEEPEEMPDSSNPLESTGKPVQMVKDVLEIIEIDAMVEAREREDSVVVDVWGDDVAILIGKGGTPWMLCSTW